MAPPSSDGVREPEAACRRRSDRILEAVVVKKTLGASGMHLVEQIADAGQTGITSKKDVAAAFEQVAGCGALKKEIVRRRTPDERRARAPKLLDCITARCQRRGPPAAIG